MNEKQTPIRPTKKQRALLVFIGTFIAEHGYSPSYREIMTGLGYTSLATVALHVRNLIARGHVRKRDFSARSLELVAPVGDMKLLTNQVAPGEEKWLVEKVERLLTVAEHQGPARSLQAVQDLAVLIAALKVLGLDAPAQAFSQRLRRLEPTPRGG